MSNNLPPVKVAKVLDPRLDINNQRHYAVLKGALVNNYQVFNTVNINNNTVQVTANPPSRDIVISRLVYKKAVFTGTITGTNTSGGPLLNPGYYGPRSYPLAAVTASETMTINDATATQAIINQYWPALLNYHNKYGNRYGQGSLAPSMMDQYQNYSDGVNTNRNPLAPYGDNSYETARGGFYGFSVSGNTNGATSVTFTLTTVEPVMVSPFVFGKHSNLTSGFVGVQNMNYTATFSNLQRILSLIQGQGVGTINITAIDVNLQAFQLLFNYITPSPLEKIPSSLVSSYFNLVSYPTRSNTPVLAGGLTSITMSSIQVTSIPRRLYFFARIDDSIQTAYTSDSYMALDQTSNPLLVTWNNNQFLSSASSYDLYNIACKNGINRSATEFFGKVGSVMCLDFGTDIGLMPDEAPGVLGNYQLQIKANFVNISNVTITPTLYVVLVYEGTCSIVNGSTSLQIGVLDRGDVVNAKFDPYVSYKTVETVYGGDFFSGLKNAFKKTVGAVKGALPYIKEGISLAKDAKTLLGRGRRMRGRGTTGGGVTGGLLVGGCQHCAPGVCKCAEPFYASGGRRISRRQMLGAGFDEESGEFVE